MINNQFNASADPNAPRYVPLAAMGPDMAQRFDGPASINLSTVNMASEMVRGAAGAQGIQAAKPQGQIHPVSQMVDSFGLAPKPEPVPMLAGMQQQPQFQPRPFGI